ncbi:MAG: SGNH/GDSL hydrolase family protein [Planctomycetota bacterium]
MALTHTVRLFLLLATFLCACATPPPPAPALDEPFRVLLLGDSISMGYTEPVGELLAGRAVVQRALRPDGERAENCQGTNHGVQHLARWLAQDGGGWDVVHFNFGLHDLKRVQPDTGKNSGLPRDPHQASPERYRAQLSEIVARLQASGARLVFATTTPVPSAPLRPHRAPADVLLYNQIARDVMSAAGVPVNDLHGFVMARLDEMQRPRDVHFSREGSGALAAEVARAVLEAAGLQP